MKPFLKSPVREIRTPGSVGVRATSWVALLPGGLATPAFYSTKRRDYRNNSGILLHGIQRRRSFANNVGSPGRRGTPFAFGFPAKKCKPLPGLFAAGIKKVLQTLTALS